jgi:hypothetical protein
MAQSLKKWLENFRLLLKNALIRAVDKKDAARDEQITVTPAVSIGESRGVAPVAAGATVTPAVNIGESKVIDPEVKVELDHIATIVEGIDELVKETKKNVNETRKGVVVAVVATLSTAIAIGLETWIGPVGVIKVIFLIALVVAVILLLVFKGGRKKE